MTTRTTTLGSIAKVTSGGTPDRENPAFWGGTVPWVKTTLVQNCEIGLGDIDEKITEAGLKKSSAKLIPSGSILMAMVGQGKTRGQVAILTTEAAINQNCAAIIVSDEANYRYVYQQLLFRYEEIRKASNSSGQQNLNARLIRELQMPLPGLTEQERIGEILVAWDTAIQKTEQLIAAQERALAALRQRIFIREVRTGFARVKLDSILTERQDLSDGQSLVYSVSVRKGLVNQIEHLGRSFSAATTDHYRMVMPGDIVYTKSPTGDFPLGIVKQSRANENVIVSPLYAVFVPKKREMSTLVDFFFESPVNARNYLHPLVQKGAKNTLSIANDQFLQGEITLPVDPDVVDRIAAFIDQARRDLFLLECRVQLFRKQKRGLMQKLLTGQWRPSVAEEVSA